MVPKEIQGFKAVPVYFSRDGNSVHELFIKEHSLRQQEENKPPGRTLFLLNIPPYVKEQCLKKLFSPMGTILSVVLQKNPNVTHNGFNMA